MTKSGGNSMSPGIQKHMKFEMASSFNFEVELWMQMPGSSNFTRGLVVAFSLYSPPPSPPPPTPRVNAVWAIVTVICRSVKRGPQPTAPRSLAEALAIRAASAAPGPALMASQRSSSMEQPTS
jgi:hypothetical protein